MRQLLKYPNCAVSLLKVKRVNYCVLIADFVQRNERRTSLLNLWWQRTAHFRDLLLMMF